MNCIARSRLIRVSQLRVPSSSTAWQMESIPPEFQRASGMRKLGRPYAAEVRHVLSLINCPDFQSPYLVTAYTACKRRAVKPGQWIVLPGAGGGLVHFAVQSMGMWVIAVDGGDEKRDLCKRLGAEAFIDFTTTKDIIAEIMRITTYRAHGVLVTAATKVLRAADRCT
jgi:NADPH-dependent curcumin reductase CurA